MQKFRKKPIVIDAIKFEYSEEGIERLRAFCGKKVSKISKERHPSAIGQAQIGTLEDGFDTPCLNGFKVKHIASEGGWIIKGIKGEFYPCKPDIFNATYEEI